MLTALHRQVGEALRPVVDLVYPPRCPGCGATIGEQAGLCQTCWEGLTIPTEPACAACQRPLSSEFADEGAICPACMAQPPRHDGIAAGALYGDVSRKLVLAFKHGRKLALAPFLARMIAARLPDDPDRLLVPVPLHRMRLWSRGFNQAALLARELEKLGKGRLHVDALVRRKRTPSLGGLGASARKRALAGAVAVRPQAAKAISNARIALVDDVLTSGATSDACVLALKKAGATEVIVACFARVV